MNKVSEERMKLRIEYSRETDLIFSDNIPAYADWVENKLALRHQPVSGTLLTDDIIIQIAYEYANQYYSKHANPISHESLTEPFIDGFKKAMELISNDR